MGLILAFCLQTMTVNTRIKVESVGWLSMSDLLIPTSRVREEARSCTLSICAPLRKADGCLPLLLRLFIACLVFS
jgi:hypothetical protein